MVLFDILRNCRSEGKDHLQRANWLGCEGKKRAAALKIPGETESNPFHLDLPLHASLPRQFQRLIRFPGEVTIMLFFAFHVIWQVVRALSTLKLLFRWWNGLPWGHLSPLTQIMVIAELHPSHLKLSSSSQVQMTAFRMDLWRKCIFFMSHSHHFALETTDLETTQHWQPIEHPNTKCLLSSPGF